MGFLQFHSSEASVKGLIWIRSLQRAAKRAGAQAWAKHALVNNSNQWALLMIPNQRTVDKELLELFT